LGVVLHNVTLVCTVHGENGKCNLNELTGIIERISPEVIFEELSQNQYETLNYFYYLYRHFGVVENFDKIDKLETKTILLYRQSHAVKHIPVDDTVDLPKNFIDVDMKYLFEYVEQSNDYCQIQDSNKRLLREEGFKYLNSDNCSNLYVTLDKITNSIVQQSKDERIINILKAWNELDEKRENEMLANIYKYCKANDFDKGLFLIGAGHRASIIAKMQKFNETEDVKINWNYSNYENIL
jgi:hypothetical protein